MQRASPMQSSQPPPYARTPRRCLFAQAPPSTPPFTMMCGSFQSALAAGQLSPMAGFHAIVPDPTRSPSAEIEAAMFLVAMRQSKTPSPARPLGKSAGGEASMSMSSPERTPTSSPRKRSAGDEYDHPMETPPSAAMRRRLCVDGDDDIVATPNIPTARAASVLASPIGQEIDFFIHGQQGQLAVCERKSVMRGEAPLNYLLVRLRGQSNTLPHDAHLSVAFDAPQAEGTITVHIARVRIKAGTLKYDFLPEPTVLEACTPTRDAFSAPLLASVFSKKCWSGVVVRGPRMFVAFVQRGGKVLYSLPMFVEISPTSNSPVYRDPVLEYSDEMITHFFSKRTYEQLGKLHSSSRKLNF